MYDLALAAMQDRVARLEREVVAHRADAARFRNDAVKSDNLAIDAHEELASMRSAIKVLQEVAQQAT